MCYVQSAILLSNQEFGYRYAAFYHQDYTGSHSAECQSENLLIVIGLYLFSALQ